MPKKAKKSATKVDEPAVAETTKSPETEAIETASETPKISSFSQLDAKNVAEKTEIPAPETEVTKDAILDPKPIASTGMDIPPQVNESSTEEKVEEKEGDSSSDEIKDWLKDIRPDTTKEIEKKNGFSFKLFFIFIFIFALIGALIGGVYYYKQGMDNQQMAEVKQEEENESMSPTAAPTEMPEEEVDLKTINVSVLNGSGVGGEAGRVKTLLTGEGFDAAKVTAGNASSSDYEKTVVSYKEDLQKSVVEKIESALSDNYTVEISTDFLEENSAYDVVVIVGEKK